LVPAVQHLNEEASVVAQVEPLALLSLVASAKLRLQRPDGHAEHPLSLGVALVMRNEFVLDPQVGAHALPVAKPSYELPASTLCSEFLHPSATPHLLGGDMVPLLKPPPALRLQNLPPQAAQLLLERDERSPPVEAVVGSAAEVATAEGVNLRPDLL